MTSSDPEGFVIARFDFVIGLGALRRWRGPLDPGAGRRAGGVRRTILDAVKAVAAGESVRIPATEAPGCKLSRVVLPR